MKLLRTAVDVRSYVLKNWRKVIPELLVTRTRVFLSPEDENLLQVDLRGDGPVQRLLLLPLASGEPRLVRGLLPRLRELGRRRDTWAGFVVPHMGASGVKVCREAGFPLHGRLTHRACSVVVDTVTAEVGTDCPEWTGWPTDDDCIDSALPVPV